nr:unnamed protein product [Callosobruchus analis]
MLVILLNVNQSTSGLEFCVVNIFFGGKNISVASIYRPPNVPVNSSDYINVFSKLDKTCIIGGDFNGHHYLWGSTDNNSPGLTLVDAIDDSPHLIFRNEGQPTRLTRPSANISAVDVTIISTDLLDISTWTVMSDTYGSDHFPILMNINSTTTNIDSHSTYKWRIHPHPDWNRFADMVHVTISGISDTASANTIITDVIHGIQNAADHVFKRKNNTHKTPSPPWWDNKCAQLAKDRKVAMRNFKNDLNIDNFVAYKHTVAKSKLLFRKKTKESWKKFCSSLNSQVNPSLIWKKGEIYTQGNLSSKL